MSQLAADLRSLTSRIYTQLRWDILCGHFAPGEKLRIADLQARFDASLSVVREALSRLAAENLADFEDQRGFRVSKASFDDLVDLMRTRRQIESIAIRQAIEQGSPSWEASVSATYGALAHLDQRVDDWRSVDLNWVAAHEAFHRTLVSGCNSAWLIRICGQMAERAQRYRYLSLSMAPRRDGAAEHKAIMQAVLARDADRAAQVLDMHFAATQKILTDAWASRPGEPFEKLTAAAPPLPARIAVAGSGSTHCRGNKKASPMVGETGGRSRPRKSRTRAKAGHSTKRNIRQGR